MQPLAAMGGGDACVEVAAPGTSKRVCALPVAPHRVGHEHVAHQLGAAPARAVPVA